MALQWLAISLALGAAGFKVPDGCVGMGGFCSTSSDCKLQGRDGWCDNDSRCYQTCHATSTRSGAEIPRIFDFCCNYGEEAPSRETPLKHWGEPRFHGKKVLVTGGDSGIGFAAAQAFYMECADLMIVGHSDKKTREAAAELRTLPVPTSCPKGKVVWAAADIRNATQVTDFVQQAALELGGLDIAVNNAGTAGGASKQIGSDGFINEKGDLYDESILDVNLKGTLKCMNAEIAYWHSSGTAGVIVNVASIAGEVAWGGPLYTSSKWAMIGFTKQAALANAARGIRINALAPGAVNTTMLRGGLSPTDPRWQMIAKAFKAKIPMGRIAEPWEMAGPITFLSSDMSSYITGITLTADGDISQAWPSGHQVSETLNYVNDNELIV